MYYIIRTTYTHTQTREYTQIHYGYWRDSVAGKQEAAKLAHTFTMDDIYYDYCYINTIMHYSYHSIIRLQYCSGAHETFYLHQERSLNK